ncbi:hypothetical protein M758_9G173300, partial [Ceratodon purpureus]
GGDLLVRNGAEFDRVCRFAPTFRTTSGIGLEIVEDRIVGFAHWRVLLEYLESCVEEELRGVFFQIGNYLEGCLRRGLYTLCSRLATNNMTNLYV